MDRDGSIPHLFACCIIRTVLSFGFCFVIIELLRIYIALFLPLALINKGYKALLFLYSNPGWIPCIRLSRFYNLFVIYSYRSVFLLFVFGMRCSKITLEQVRPSHAPSATPNASPSCSRAVATSRRVEIHDAIGASAHLPSADGDGSYSETSVL